MSKPTKKPNGKRRQESKVTVKKVPPGVKLLRTFDGHRNLVRSIAFDPQGEMLASASDDGTVKFWDVRSGNLIRTLEGDKRKVVSVAFDPLGGILASGSGDGRVKFWDVRSGNLIRTLKGHEGEVSSVTFDPQGEMLATAGEDKTVKLWDVRSGNLIRTLEGHESRVTCVVFDPHSELLASSSRDATLKLWDVRSGTVFRTLEGHAHDVESVAFDPKGKMLASGSRDHTVKLWETRSGKLLRTLEGHTGYANIVVFSPDGRLLVSKSTDHTIRLWDCSTWETAAIIPEPTEYEWIPALAFHPTLPLLAAAGSNPGTESAQRHANRLETGLLVKVDPKKPAAMLSQLIHIWELDFSALLTSGRKTNSVCYKNAKVVLVGDSGVGKSGLALRLSTGNFEPTESTHGRHVWRFDSREVPLDDGRKQTRETLLWDLAGQPGYRLVHQLNIDEAAVALVLVDARDEKDPLGPAEFWSKAIDQAKSVVPITKILVEARADRGGVAVSPNDLDQFCERFGFAGWFRTSAKTGLGVDKVKQAISDAIPWENLPEVISTTLFTKIRDFLQAEKQRGDQVLVEQLNGFRERYILQTGHTVSDAEFRTVVGRLAASGLAQFLIFSVLNGGEKTDYVLMQPEYLDGYASAIINQARQDPRGIGHVSEARVRQGDLGLHQRERISDRWAEELVIGEAIEQLLIHDIALRERLPEDHEEAGDFLVLPSQYTRNSPYPGKKLPGVSFEFDGSSRAIFATLVVRLAHHRHFAARDFWKNAACYATQEGWEFIVVLEEVSPSRGRLMVYFDNNPSRKEQISFLSYVESHLNFKSLPGSVVARRESRCPACGYPWDEAVVQNRLLLGKRDIICPNCEVRSPLLELMLSDADRQIEYTKEDARQIGTDAETARKRQLAVTAIRGKEQFGEYDIFLSYNSKDRDAVLRIGEMLKGVGIRPWIDVWDLIPGKPWQAQLEVAIDKVRSAAVCVGPSGIGPWQDQEMAAFIRKFIKRQSPVMPVLLPGLEAVPDLPTFLEGFMWVDLRDLNDENPRPLANLIAGILGRRPIEIQHDGLADQVAAILSPSAIDQPSSVSSKLPSIILPVQQKELSPDELAMVVQQAAQLLGISSRSVKLLRTEPGSVRLVLELDDLIAVSQLFLMAEKGDPNLIKFFDRCQISINEFQELNAASQPKLVELRDEEKARRPDELDRKIGNVLQPGGLRTWAGGEGVRTLAVVFTDIVDSTRLCHDLGDAAWDGYRQLHFAHIQQLIEKSSGYFVKNTGDGILATFHNVDDAVTFGRGIALNTGHAVIRVRVGVHIGQVTIDGDDTFGRHVNLAARVMSALKQDGLMITDAAKSDLASRGTESLKKLRWEPHQDILLKGLPYPQTLWELDNRR